MLTESVFHHWYNPAPEQIASTVPAFLAELGGPTIIHLNGLDNTRCRVVVTLLHGNEPSGLKAVHQLLYSGCQPEVTLLLAVVYVDAALAEPLFSHRFLPGQQDMNRLFSPPFEGRQATVAEALLDIIRAAQPEAVIDIHNTSGEGPAFTVCVEPHTRYLDLATLFTHRLIITGHRLGALMEVSDLGCPVLTVECGGSMQVQSDEIAYQGMMRFFTRPQLYTSVAVEEMDIYHHPVRLELIPGGGLCYDNEPQPSSDITLPYHIDRRNFGVVRPDTALAWLGPRGIRALRALDEQGEDIIDDLFVEEGGKLYPRTTLKLFMATTNPEIAISDCLLYAVKETDHGWEETADDEAGWK
ncbi:MAG: succinylglutamate desuccinylase/aspartoacylase family protein [Porticoccus sp.]